MKTAYKFCKKKCQFGGPGNLKQAYSKKYLKLAKPKNQVRKYRNAVFNCTTDTVQSKDIDRGQQHRMNMHVHMIKLFY